MDDSSNNFVIETIEISEESKVTHTKIRKCEFTKRYTLYFSDIKGDFKGPCGVCRQVFAEVGV